MTPEAIADIAGSTGIIVSLIYLALQIRQNTRAVRGSTNDALVGHQIAMDQMLTADAGLATAFLVGLHNPGGVPEQYRASVSYVMLATWRFLEEVFLHHRRGTLDPLLWPGWRNQMLSTFAQPGSAELWRIRGATFAPEFREFLETNRPDVPMPPLSEAFPRKD